VVPRAALLLAPPYFGFQPTHVRCRAPVHRGAAHAEEVVRAHAELVRVQSALAEKAAWGSDCGWHRICTIHSGHHLVALSLNLELAAHESQGRRAQPCAPLRRWRVALLHDVKEIVHSSRDEPPVDLSFEILRLAEELPRPKLHVICPPDLHVQDGSTSRAMLRAVQEIVTNCIRHGEAENLWITIERTTDQLRLAARDDVSD